MSLLCSELHDGCLWLVAYESVSSDKRQLLAPFVSQESAATFTEYFNRSLLMARAAGASGLA